MIRRAIPPTTPPATWSVADAAECYGVASWGKGYFAINERGGVTVHPQKDPDRSIDLKGLVDDLRGRGIELPILLRFTDILQHQLQEIHECFAAAIRDHGFGGGYLGAYPIKVNQQRQVVEDLLACGKELPLGLECGSKPELMLALAMTEGNGIPVICNGFKDEDYIEMVVIAQKLGKSVIPIVEKFTEVDLILAHAARLRVRPVLGVRAKLSTRGAGRWEFSGGERSKFGLNVTELLRVLDRLKADGREDCLRLLHFHLGSQITDSFNIKSAITEVSRIYVELCSAGAGLRYLDVGGGLGIDYDGTQSNADSSTNYSIKEYTNDVISRVQAVCDERGVAHPTIITESGRATVAYHSVMVVDVVGVRRRRTEGAVAVEIGEAASPLICTLAELAGNVDAENLLESYHRAVEAYDSVLNSFNLGHLGMRDRSQAENLYGSVLHEVLRIAKTLDFIPEEVKSLEDELSDTYLCNFSVFQSLPDSWAIHQLFPIMPIHRLDEEPLRRGVLADMTCDSDGKVDRFICRDGTKKTLELHDFSASATTAEGLESEYFLGVFLIGAYQEVLGDLHNLFGDTHSVHVRFSGEAAEIDTVVKGDTVSQVLGYVQYTPRDLVGRVRKDVETALREKRISLQEARRFVRFYEQSLDGYTYLTSRPSGAETDEDVATDESAPVEVIRVRP